MVGGCGCFLKNGQRLIAIMQNTSQVIVQVHQQLKLGPGARVRRGTLCMRRRAFAIVVLVHRAPRVLGVVGPHLGRAHNGDHAPWHMRRQSRREGSVGRVAPRPLVSLRSRAPPFLLLRWSAGLLDSRTALPSATVAFPLGMHSRGAGIELTEGKVEGRPRFVDGR